MIIDVDAVYESGVLRLKEPVDIPEKAEVHVTIQGPSKSRTSLGERLREIRAQIIGAGELITTEKRSRSIHRVTTSCCPGFSLSILIGVSSFRDQRFNR